MSTQLPALAVQWRARAEELRRYAPAAAQAFDVAADELERALRDAADEPLTLEQAAAESGYSAERLRHMIAEGTIPQAGRRGAPRVRRGDLPQKPRTQSAFDPGAAARKVLER